MPCPVSQCVTYNWNDAARNAEKAGARDVTNGTEKSTIQERSDSLISHSGKVEQKQQSRGKHSKERLRIPQ
jgi:hypothetical protein